MGGGLLPPDPAGDTTPAHVRSPDIPLNIGYWTLDIPPHRPGLECGGKTPLCPPRQLAAQTIAAMSAHPKLFIFP